jgi:hypothetical protein
MHLRIGMSANTRTQETVEPRARRGAPARRVRALTAAGWLAAASAAGCAELGGEAAPPSELVLGENVHMLRVRPGEPAAQSAAPLAAGLAKYYGGKVLAGARVYATNWNSNVNAQVLPKMVNLYRAVLDSEYIDWLTEYDTKGLLGVDGQAGSNQRIGRGTLGGQFTLTPQATGTSLSDAQIQQELSHQMDTGAIPVPDDDAFYAVNFPSSIKISMGTSTSCVDFCAYHGTFTRNGRNVYYAVLPSLQAPGCNTGCGGAAWLDNTTAVATHELVETITDAEIGLTSTVKRPLAWYSTALGEIGDACNAQQGTVVGRDGVSYTVQKQYDNASGSCIVSKPWSKDDQSARTGIAGAAGNPIGFVFGRQIMAFRGSDSHIHQFWTTNNDTAWAHTDVTAATGAPAATGTPTGYVFGTQILGYRGSDSHIHQLFTVADNTQWVHNDITALTAAPPAAGDPHGYVFGTQILAYRSSDGHVHQLFTVADNTQWVHQDITAAAGAGPAAGDPIGYVFGTQILAYRGTDNHIHQLWTSNGNTQWNQIDATAAAGAPAAQGDPSPYVLGTQILAYRGTDNHIRQLYTVNNNATWTFNDLTAMTGSAPAAGNPFGFVFRGQQHIVYRDAAGHIHALFTDPRNLMWSEKDLTASAGAALAAGDPFGYVDNGFQIVAYRSSDGHIQQLFSTID